MHTKADVVCINTMCVYSISLLVNGDLGISVLVRGLVVG